jgi:hypothetical protein
MAHESLFTESLAAAEASRDPRAYSGFLAGLFEGVVRWHLFAPYSIPTLSDEARAFLHALRRLLTEQVDPERVDRDGQIGDEVITALAQIGAFGIKIPKAYGGLGFSQSEYHAIATLLGSHDASTTVLLSAHNSLGAAEPVKLIGTFEQKQRFLPRLARGEISGFALTEPHAGCDIWDLRSYAIPVEEHGVVTGYRLTADKLYTTNAPRRDGEFLASLLVVIAQIVRAPEDLHRPKPERRFGAFIVETAWPGCRCTRLRFMGVRGIYNGAVRLRDVFVPVENRLGEEGTGLRRALESLTIGRLALPAACLGNLKQCLWLARQRARQRVQYDRPIGEHTDIGARLVRMASRVLALEALVAITGLWADAGEDVRLESAAAKILATEWLLDSLLDLFGIYGGRAFETAESLRTRGETPTPVERMIRDALINVIWEGTNGILTLWIGREGLANYVTHGQAFLDRQLADMLRAAPFFAKVAARTVSPLPEVQAPWVGWPYRTWQRFVSQQCRALARATLRAAVRHRHKLIPKQLLITRLVQAGLGLFALEALLWYASQNAIKDRALVPSLVTDFGSRVQEAFDPTPLLSARIPSWNHDTTVFRLAKSILAGEAAWLEEGIIKMPLVTEDQPAPLQPRAYLVT